MKTHVFEPHPEFTTRDLCEFKFDDDGRMGHCGKPRSDLVHQVETASPRGGVPAAEYRRVREALKAAKESLETWHDDARSGVPDCDCDDCVRVMPMIVKALGAPT